MTISIDKSDTRSEFGINEELEIKQAMDCAWKLIAPTWPLHRFIAHNPLSGLEDLPFSKAVIEGAQLFQGFTLPGALQKTNRETIKWCQVFFDERQAIYQMPKKHEGLYPSWTELVPYDAEFMLNIELPADPWCAIRDCLEHAGLSHSEYEQYFKMALNTLPGWAGLVQYYSQWCFEKKYAPFRCLRRDFLAIRLLYLRLFSQDPRELLHEFNHVARKQTICVKNMYAREVQYKIDLLDRLRLSFKQKIESVPEAQFVFCIDVRSEPMRRALERVGKYETFSYAGFFGLPVSFQSANSVNQPSCPVIVEAKHALKTVQPKNQKDAIKKILKEVFKKLKYNVVTPFSLAEATGLYFGFWMSLKTFFPRLTNNILRLIHKKEEPKIDLESIPFEYRCRYAEQLLLTIGLREKFSSIVVLTGHESTSQNNPHSGSLDCGACGGRSGRVNAQLMAQILNDATVRQVLKEKKIMIPDETRFIAAVHNTMDDTIELFPDGKPCKKLDDHILKAADILRREKEKKEAVRTNNWSETRPEWGLAKNAAFIIGPRWLTQDINLEGRVFLHCYDPKDDQDNAVLESILNGPLLVAQWINAQYLFSTLDNTNFGAGSKTSHNVTAKIAVMQGNASDLMGGLPLQSVFQSADERYHEPQRLLVIIYADKKNVFSIVEKNPKLKQLVDNEWIMIEVIEPGLFC